MKTLFKIPYEGRNTSPAFELMLVSLMIVALLIWFRG